MQRSSARLGSAVLPSSEICAMRMSSEVSVRPGASRFDRDIYERPTVAAASTRSVIVPGLPAGEYVMQLREAWGFHDSAALLVRC